MSPVRTSAVLAMLVALTACNRTAAPDASGADPAGAAVATDASAPPAAPALKEFGSALLWADPLPTCDGKQVTKIHWSKKAVADGPASIELGDTNPGIFARIGDVGEKMSGEWAAPGGVIVLRGDDGVARARLVLKGPASCSAP